MNITEKVTTEDEAFQAGVGVIKARVASWLRVLAPVALVVALIIVGLYVPWRGHEPALPSVPAAAPPAVVDPGPDKVAALPAPAPPAARPIKQTRQAASRPQASRPVPAKARPKPSPFTEQ